MNDDDVDQILEWDPDEDPTYEQLKELTEDCRRAAMEIESERGRRLSMEAMETMLQQREKDKSNWLWECVRPYDPDTATKRDRLNSCEKTENGTFKNRTLCYEDCYYKNKKKKSEDEMRKVRKVAKNFMAHQGSKRARGMAGMR
jgi:5'-3' exonuclease